MSKYNINNNPNLIKQMINAEKEADIEYYKKNPDSIIPSFENKIRNMGFKFEVSSQVFGFLPKYKSILLPIIVEYYEKAEIKQDKLHFLRFFNHKNFDEIVPILLKDFYNDELSKYRWHIADTMYTIRSKKYINDYLSIISNQKYGSDRQMIILLVGKLKIEQAIPILISLLDDKDVKVHAINALGQFENPKFKIYFKQFEDDKDIYIRKEAAKALKKINL